MSNFVAAALGQEARVGEDQHEPAHEEAKEEGKGKGLQMLGEIVTAVKWLGGLVSDSQGTATVQSETASWKQPNVHELAPHKTNEAMLVRAFREGAEADAYFSAVISVQGNFREDPPEIDGARFIVHGAQCGHGTELNISFHAYGDAATRGGVWVVPFNCDGTFKAHEVQVKFHAPIYVDTSGHVTIEDPQIEGDSSGEQTTLEHHSFWDPSLPMPERWKWEAAFGAPSGTPYLRLEFKPS